MRRVMLPHLYPATGAGVAADMVSAIYARAPLDL